MSVERQYGDIPLRDPVCFTHRIHFIHPSGILISDDVTKAVADNPELRSEFEFLFESQGVARSYIDYGGNTVAIALENRLRVLGLLGIEIQDPNELAEAVSRLE